MSRWRFKLAGLAFVAALSLTAFASPAAARAVTVRTEGLDLSNVADAKTLFRRLDRAVDLVCEGSVARFYPAGRRTYLACYHTTMADALARVDAPLVREYYARRLAARSSGAQGQSTSRGFFL
jgi:UrcA family protein